MKFLNVFKKKIVAGCGHKTLKKDKVTAFGESCETTIPISNGNTAYCHRCLEKMAIRCAWCGKAIFIGDPVTLYSPKDEDLKMPDYAVLHNEEITHMWDVFVGIVPKRVQIERGFGIRQAKYSV